jgi:MATE family multidrug resistance protein
VLICTRPLIIAAYTPDPSVAAAAMPLLLLVAFFHPWDALQCVSAFILRGHKIAVVPTVIYALTLWGAGMGGGYYFGFNVGGHVPHALTGASGFWFAACLSGASAALMLLGYWHVTFNRNTTTVGAVAS